MIAQVPAWIVVLVFAVAAGLAVWRVRSWQRSPNRRRAMFSTEQSDELLWKSLRRKGGIPDDPGPDRSL